MPKLDPMGEQAKRLESGPGEKRGKKKSAPNQTPPPTQVPPGSTPNTLVHATGKVAPTLAPRGLPQPKFGQQNEDGASVPAETRDVDMTLMSYFCSLPGCYERPINISMILARFPPQSHNLPKQ